MKRLFTFFVSFTFVTQASANTIAVSSMENLPRKVVNFANDLYAEVGAEKSLIQLFLESGIAKSRLSKEEEEIDQASSIQFPKTKDADGAEHLEILLHGCNGVFTDENGIVYFWRLSSPRILYITSQKYESTFIVLEKPHQELLSSARTANRLALPTDTTVRPPLEHPSCSAGQ